MYKAVIWDLDGTLLDTTDGVKYAVRCTIKKLGLPELDNFYLDKFVGPPMQLSFQKYYSMNETDALAAANLFRAIYKEKSLFMANLYPGTLDVLRNLNSKGYKMAVATNKSHDNAIEILRYFKISQFCDFMMGSDLEGKLKKADIIRECLMRLAVLPSEAVYVGDSNFDLEGAKKIGMDFIGVTYGFGFRKDDDIGFKLVNSVSEIEDMI